jgi:hypothetical protein
MISQELNSNDRSAPQLTDSRLKKGFEYFKKTKKQGDRSSIADPEED